MNLVDNGHIPAKVAWLVYPGLGSNNKHQRDNNMNEELKKRLEQAHRILHMEGLAEDASRGHVTVKSAAGRIYVKPWGVGFQEVKARDFQGVDSEGRLLEGKGRVHSELVLHLEIYRKRPDVRSVIHLHPCYAVLLSSVFQGKINTISQQGVRFTGQIPFFTSAALIQSPEQAEQLAQALGKQCVVLMKNHGITVAGESVEEAVILAIHFEQAAKDHLMANLFGKPSGMLLAEAKKISANNYTPTQYQMIWDFYWRKFKTSATVAVKKPDLPVLG
jgi:ribulose-5-phosphate 4-epimerase/fuculose-1-phosphate aldolase